MLFCTNNFVRIVVLENIIECYPDGGEWAIWIAHTEDDSHLLSSFGKKRSLLSHHTEVLGINVDSIGLLHNVIHKTWKWVFSHISRKAKLTFST